MNEILNDNVNKNVNKVYSKVKISVCAFVKIISLCIIVDK
jgi:hypothetical protein